MSRTATVEQVLKENDFDTIWNYLENKFGYSKEWRVEWRSYIDDAERQATPVRAFLDFGQREINPLLNAALRRNEYHPTFMRMLYVMFVMPKIQGR